MRNCDRGSSFIWRQRLVPEFIDAARACGVLALAWRRLVPEFIDAARACGVLACLAYRYFANRWHSIRDRPIGDSDSKFVRNWERTPQR
eukprot:1076360-Prorocentrum_minimum.AAC.1